MKCPMCGKKINSEATHCPHCGEAINRRAVMKKRLIIAAAAIAAIALLAWGAYAIFHKDKSDLIADNNMSEPDSWELICHYRDTNNPDSLEGALEKYIRAYGKGQHAFDVKTLRERLNKEKKYWNNVEESGAKREMVEKYLNEYKEEGFFYLRAIDKLDSITFFEKQELNTVEAYQDYLDLYPDGRYEDQAKANLAKLDAVPLTDAEEENVKKVIVKHFEAMAQKDTMAINATIAKNLSSYLGKKPCKPRDVNEYVRHMFQDSERQVKFELTDFKIKKIVIIEDGDPIYNVTFVLNETMNKPAEHAIVKDTERDYDGTAILNDDMLITSLLLEDI